METISFPWIKEKNDDGQVCGFIAIQKCRELIYSEFRKNPNVTEQHLLLKIQDLYRPDLIFCLNMMKEKYSPNDLYKNFRSEVDTRIIYPFLKEAMIEFAINSTDYYCCKKSSRSEDWRHKIDGWVVIPRPNYSAVPIQVKKYFSKNVPYYKKEKKTYTKEVNSQIKYCGKKATYFKISFDFELNGNKQYGINPSGGIIYSDGSKIMEFNNRLIDKDEIKEFESLFLENIIKPRFTSITA